MKKINLAVVLGALMIGAFSMISSAQESRTRPKPQPPLRITITPAQPGVTSETIKPGDVVELNVSAVAFVDTDALQVTINIPEGAVLVAGELSWTGPAMKNEMKTLPITIKVPLKGNGSVKAHLSITRSGSTVFTTSSEYVLGGVKKSKPESERPVRKDSRGKDVIEYR